MPVQETDLVLARLQGFLQAFEWFNHKTNHGCSYTVYSIPKGADIPAALAARFELRPEDFQVERMTDVERAIREVFGRFLFLFRDPDGGRQHGDYLDDPRMAFSIMSDHGKTMMLDDLIAMIRPLDASSAWRVVPIWECGELQEWCFQDNLLLELPNRLCLLHFGISD